MKPEDDTPLTISKWPFYLGDLLLVATALSIAVLGEWDLSTGEILACVMSVGLGAGLFVLPYLYEYTMRLREDSDDIEASLRVLSRQIKHIESRMAEMERQLARRNDAPDLKKSLAPFEKRLEDLQGLEKKTEAGAEALASLAARFDSIDQRIEEMQAVPEDLVEEVEVPKPVSQKNRPKKKNNLLKRAMSEKQEPDLQAVSRIIEAVPHEPKKVIPPIADESPSISDESPPIPATKTEPESRSQVNTDSTEDETTPQVNADSTEAVSDSEPGLSSEFVDEPDFTADSVEVPAPEAVSDTKSSNFATEPVEEATASTDLFGGPVDSSSPKKRKRRGKNDTVLTVNALIGIGNKPYLRGSGAGLNWEIGQPMNFQSIGKWEWTVSDEMEDVIEIQVYCNDQDPDQSGKHRLQPGEKLQISPKF